MTKQVALSPEDTQKLHNEYKKMLPKWGLVAVGSIVFYSIVLSLSSITINSADHWVFTGFCLLFLVIVSSIMFIRRQRFSQDVQAGVKVIIDGQVSTVYSKRNDDYYGSFTLNGTRYFAEGANFQRIKPDAFVTVEIAPKSRVVLTVV